MQLAGPQSTFVTKPFEITVTDYTPTSLADARPKVDALARFHGVEVSSYKVAPLVLESFPTQSIVKGALSGPSDAVNAALEMLGILDQQI